MTHTAELLPWPQAICSLTLGEKPSDGEITCGGGDDYHCIPKGHPVYWQSPHPEYGDCDGYCLSCAIEHAESMSFMAGCAKADNTRAPDPAQLRADRDALLEALEEFQTHVIRHACVWDEADNGSHHHPIWQKVATLIARIRGEG